MDEKAKLLGLAMASFFNLKKDKDGLYDTAYGKMSWAGIGNSILKTVEDHAQFSENELRKLINDNELIKNWLKRN